MRLNLEPIIHVPGASIPFGFSMDLSDLELGGEYPAKAPLLVSGRVRNMAGALVLEGEAKTTLSLSCDRCRKEFEREKGVILHSLLAKELSGEDAEEIILLDGNELDLGDLAYTAFVLDMDMKNLCSEDCKGLCSGCGADLNLDDCRCKPEMDPRWAALAQFLDKPE